MKKIDQAQIGGIVRNVPPSIAKDGSCNELLNLRFKDGAWRPTGAKQEYGSQTIFTGVSYLHELLPTRKAFIVHQSDDELRANFYVNGSYSTYQTLIADTSGNDLRFSSLGNVLVIIDKTDEVIYYAIFDNSSFTYQYVGEIPPPLLDITFDTTGGTDVTGNFVSGTDYTYDVSGSYAIEALFAKWAETEATKNESGIFCGWVGLRFAYELFDGSFICHSRIHIISIGDFTFSVNSKGGGSGTENIDWTYVVETLQSTVNSEASYISDIQDRYKGIIKGIRVFITVPWQIFNEARGNWTAEVLYVDDEYESKTLLETRVSYHSVDFVPLEDIENGLVRDIDVGVVADIPTRETLGIDNFTHHKLYSCSPLGYNERIFYGDIITKFFAGYLYSGFGTGNIFTFYQSGYTPSTAYGIFYEIDIQTSQGVKTVVSDILDVDYYYDIGSGNEKCFVFAYDGSIIMYPDSRATKMRVYAETTPDYYYLAGEVPMKAHPVFNFAYVDTPSDYVFADSFDTWTDSGVSSVKDTLHDGNRIQATKQNNPFLFPAVNSYRAGQGFIIAMATNALAISQGQYGMFPIFALASDGVWTLNISQDPTILIDSVVPMSRHVCNNADSVISVDGGFMFSTAEGLFISSGGKFQEISQEAEGDYKSEISSNPALLEFINNANYIEVADYLCSKKFKHYLNNAVLGYDPSNKEIIVTDSSKGYSWVFSLESGVWHKISEVFDNFVNDYPNAFGVKSDYKLYDLASEDDSGYVQVFLITNPIKVVNDVFKKIHRLIVRGMFNTEDGKYTVCYLYGSIDRVTWELLNGMRNYNNFRDMQLSRSLYNCKEIIITLGGSLDVDSYITHYDLTFQERYSKKLR